MPDLYCEITKMLVAWFLLYLNIFQWVFHMLSRLWLTFFPAFQIWLLFRLAFISVHKRLCAWICDKILVELRAHSLRNEKDMGLDIGFIYALSDSTQF